MTTRVEISTESVTYPARTAKSRRIALRLTEQLADQLERAVALSGRNKTELITEAISDKAQAVIREQRLLELTERDMDALQAALATPPAPNAAMRRSIARWRESNSVE
jgi:uncharacterized protein (DUF1778 family)